MGSTGTPPPLGWRLGQPPKNKPPLHMCYHVKFSSSVTKGVYINRKEPKHWGALRPHSFGRGVADYLKTSILPICVITSKVVVLRQRVYA